jgi:hypothetical protein
MCQCVSGGAEHVPVRAVRSIFPPMNSRVWTGVGAGLIVFLMLASVSYLTMLRVPVLKVLGHEYAALQLRQQHGTETASPAAPAYRSVAGSKERLHAWHKRNATITVFSFLGWLVDLWPWLLGLGLCLPVLGGLIGAQVPAPGGAPVRHQTGPKITPARPPRGERVPSEPDATPTLASQTPPPEPDVVSAPAPPPPPEEWSWNARPAARTAPGRPKVPPVKSPNGDAL